MWDEAVRLFEAHRQRLAEAAIPLRARLEPDQGLMCTYAEGVVRLALPDPALPGGALRAALVAGLMGIDVEQVVWLFRTQLPRLVAHEIGHALRDEAGCMGADPWEEEAWAERLADLLSRPLVGEADRTAMRDLLGPVAQALGGLPEAIATWRDPARALAHPVLRDLVPRRPSVASYRDLDTFLRVSVGWGYLDLLLESEDDLPAYRADLQRAPTRASPSWAAARRRPRRAGSRSPARSRCPPAPS